MGLDWNPGNKPKPGLEDVCEKLLRAMEAAEGAEREALRARFFEVSTSAHETLEAPRVGFDAAADEWARARFRDDPPADATEDEYLARLRGFYVLDLVPPCDGLPPYSHGFWGYVEQFSFRAEFLVDCKSVIGDALLAEAYERKSASDLIRYGNDLLSCGRRYAEQHGCSEVEAIRDDRDKIGDSDEPPRLAHIVLWAAKWCLFWGSRGHTLDPYV